MTSKIILAGSNNIPDKGMMDYTLELGDDLSITLLIPKLGITETVRLAPKAFVIHIPTKAKNQLKTVIEKIIVSQPKPINIYKWVKKDLLVLLQKELDS